MPEGDTIFRAARTLQRALAGKTVTRFESVLPRLCRIDVDTPIRGRTIESVSAVGKWNLMRFSGDLILVTHMRMNGSWHIYRSGERWRKSRSHVRIVIETPDFVAVAFDVPVAEFHTERSLARHLRITALGPDLLAAGFDEKEAVRRMRQRDSQEIGPVLLNQRVMAGVGNAFKSEILFASEVNPFLSVGSLSDAQVRRIVHTAQRLLKANTGDASTDRAITYTGFRRTTGRSDPAARLWVYGRAGESCRYCGTTIACRKQGFEARLTYWCPRCQPLPTPEHATSPTLQPKAPTASRRNPPRIKGER